MAKLRIAVFISGRGTNLQSLIDASTEDSYPAEIALVLSNVAGAFGLRRAENAGIPTVVVDHRDYEGRESFEDVLQEKVAGAKAELVCLAGFMRLLTDNFVNRWRERLINIHPSLLPSFKGIHVHDRVIEHGARFSGCTVHYVRPAMDDGPIIAQACVPVHSDDDGDALAARVLSQEHRIYPLVVRLIAEGRVRVVNERVLIDGAETPDGALLNPGG